MTKKIQEYFEGIGRRKESVARVRAVDDGKSDFTINGKSAKEFFPVKEFQNTIFAPLEAIGLEKKLTVSVKVKGGGIRGQSDAIKLGLSRALVKYDEELHRVLKDLDFLKRDSRKKERKKPGLKKARRSAQWRKR
ncbi:MAG: 30S ribosomal protein S9 [Candidatus Moranbacteria bacterium]|nr:30S ribosomal protein S9 [Candidatus Moranbacteria bacterium]